MTTIIAERAQADVPITVHVDRDGGITGLTIVARIFNGADLTQWLDLDDGTFKGAAHVDDTLDVPEVNAVVVPGLYSVDGGFDLSAITLPAATNTLIVQYEITAGGETGNAVDQIQIVDQLDDIEAAIGALNDLSIADVQTALTSQGYTAARALLLDNLDASVAGVGVAVLAAISALNDLAIADIQTAMTNQGYTAARALLLDFLDAAITSRPTAAEINTYLETTAGHGAGAWTSGGLTVAQDDRLRKVWKVLGQDPANPTTHVDAVQGGSDGSITTPDAEIDVTVEQLTATSARFTQS